MKIVKTEGIIVGEINYSESSKILKILTKDYGLISVMSKGCRNIKSKLRGVSGKLVYGNFNLYYKEEGISTCVDTSGMVALTDGIKEVLKYTDLVLLDIKHIDEEKCKELVGFSNKRELEFARYLSDNNIKMWIRQVLVPGYTDAEEDLLKLKDFLLTLNTVEKVQILPYHSMGKYKWKNLGLEYPLEGVRDANQDDVDRAKKILEV